MTDSDRGSEKLTGEIDLSRRRYLILLLLMLIMHVDVDNVDVDNVDVG